MSDLKRSPEVGTGAAVLSGANLVPHAMLAAMARHVMRVLRTYPQRSIHTVTTNVPGPVKPHYVLGRELREYLPFVPITEGMRFGVAVLSYNGHVAFGVTGDYDTAPDVGRFATAIEAELEVLLKRTEHASAGPTSRRRVPSGGG